MRHVASSLRRVRLTRSTPGRRFNSSTPSSSSSSSAARNVQVQKAVEGAQKALSQSAATVQKYAGPVGERIGGALGSYREPLVFNFKVFTSILRQVYQVERLAFPTELMTWTRAYSEIWAKATSSQWWLNTLRTGGWAAIGIAGLEAYGIFSIGEIIGRRHLIGYKLKE